MSLFGHDAWHIRRPQPAPDDNADPSTMNEYLGTDTEAGE